MVQTYPKKLVQVIAIAELERHLVEIAERYNCGGYTVLEVRGSGRQGTQTGYLEAETNIQFLMILASEQLEAVLTELDQLIRLGHHMIVFVTDTQVLRDEKFACRNPASRRQP